MSTMSDHIETALDQLRNADDAGRRLPDRPRFFLDAAKVHALIAIAHAITEAGAGATGWSETDAQRIFGDPK